MFYLSCFSINYFWTYGIFYGDLYSSYNLFSNSVGFFNYDSKFYFLLKSLTYFKLDCISFFSEDDLYESFGESFASLNIFNSNFKDWCLS